MNKCPNCGTEFEGNFCPNCGTALAQNVCPKCKAPLVEGAKFCANCGHSLEKKPKLEWLTKAIAFCKTNWKKIAIATTALIALILIIAIPISIANNIFRAGKVSKINIGDDQATVEKLLGKPTDKSDGSWHYLDKKAKKIYQKMNGIGEDEESFEDLFDDLEKYEKLYSKLEKMTYSYIKVSFDGNGKVTEVFLDRKHHFDENDDYAGEKKYAKKISTDPKEIEVNQATFNGETKYDITTKISDVIYTVKYTDKSFYRKAMGYATTELSEDGKSYVLQWKDKLGEYRITLSTRVTEGDFILTNENGSFKISSRGTLLSWEGNSETLVIPDGVTSIGYAAFSGCSNLTSVTIPDSVTSIGERAFAYCTGLTSVYYTGDIAGWCGISFGSSDANPLYYAHNLYLNDTLLTELVIPDTVTAIKACAFSGCSSLTSIMIGSNVTSIGGVAFSGCSSLTSISIPVGVTSIGEYAFYNCSKLTSITIPNGVTYIGSEAFHGSNLRYNTYDNGLYLGNSSNPYLVLIKASDESDESITSCAIHENTKIIANAAFAYCSGLTTVTISDSVTSIGNNAFAYCSGLTTVTIPDSVTSIGNHAFDGCTGLTAVTIPDSVTSIGQATFFQCTGLTSITIPDSVTSIGSNAFLGCTGLTAVTIPDSVTSIGGSAFYECSGLTSVTIGNGITNIDRGVFDGCSSLTSVTIPNSVTRIEQMAFWRCSGLTSVTIPNSVTYIGWNAFSDCTALTTITFTGTKKQWKAIQKTDHDDYSWDSNTGAYTIRCTDGNISK